MRGINGGARATGSVLKLMIDGMPVDYRPTTGNFFGEELIPLAVVERVEVIRGPASALYGANAFLGVVNVITRTGQRPWRARGSRLRHGAASTRAAAAAAMVGGGSEHPGRAGAAQLRYSDRSGLTLPALSPAWRARTTAWRRAASRGTTTRGRARFRAS